MDTANPARKSSFDMAGLLACARGELFGPGNARLPLPPMLMFDRITKITDNGGSAGKGEVEAEFDLNPNLWFFKCHFQDDPVMPGCLGLDALWQMVGFFLGWAGGLGKGRALGVGEVKLTAMILPTAKKITYYVDLKRVIMRRLVMGVADGIVKVDGVVAFEVKDMKVGLFSDAMAALKNAVNRRRLACSLRSALRASRKERNSMRRVVVTGMGIVSSIGNNTQEVVSSLREAKSGIVAADDYTKMNFRSQVHGSLKIDLDAAVDRRARRFQGDSAGYCWVAMNQAIADAGLEEKDVSNPRTGLIVGSGGPSTKAIVGAADITRQNSSPKRIGPFAVPKAMSSTVSANLSTWFKTKGVNYSISSACSTSANCIGNAAEMIQWGKQDVMFAGGGEELDWTLSELFDAMGAMSSKYNATPEKASRAYDKNRDGFVISGGGGILILEELEHARARGAKIYAEMIGYGATADGADMVAPSGEGAVRCMQMALETVKAPIDYINPHATSTPVGDIPEINAIREVFGDKMPPISATKSLTGHSQGAAGVHEAIYTLLMMQSGFVCESANIDEIDPAVADANIVRRRIDNAQINTALSNSFGFGGTNATLVFQRHA